MCARIPGFPKSENLSRVMLVKHVEAFRHIFDCAATEGSHRQPAAPALAVPQHILAGAEGPVPPAMGDVPSRFVFREGSEPQASPSPIAAGAAVADATSLPTRPVLQPRGLFPSPPSSTATPGVGAPPAPSPAVDPRLAFFADVHAPVSQPSVLQQHVQANAPSRLAKQPQQVQAVVWAIEQEDDREIAGVPEEFAEEVLALAECDVGGFHTLAALSGMELVPDNEVAPTSAPPDAEQ
ncbi:hypothetical protein CYMTET_38117 [Cymbomonas tetramitiformis]|uniref:Uncharacterized protein n=1 Tax=Cymbomonas tetramitiformis TaxID=36881 RepID=A0AAE0CE51_9CHLO|nr:hypothetical protein CYMTET_38117 [Cymbomonas tetramitiformis]